MPTADSVKNKLQGLIATANEATGSSDTTLTAAVNTLVSGYGQGSGGGEIAKSIINKSVTSIDFDGLNVTEIGDYSFYNCNNLANIETKNVTMVGSYAFNNCSSLTAIDFPVATKIGGRAFLGCTSLLSVNIPNAAFTSAHSSVLEGCTKLQTIRNIQGSLANKFLAYCTALESAYLTHVTKFVGAQIFIGCSVLKTVVLPHTALVTLSNVNVFADTPFAAGGTGGTVYVPAALIPEYQTATNWSTLYAAGTCNFVAIEGSEYE